MPESAAPVASAPDAAPVAAPVVAAPVAPAPVSAPAPVTGNPSQTDAPADAAAPTPAAPAPVVYDLKPPEGATMAPEQIAAVVDLAKQHGIAPAAAQAFLNHQAATAQAAAAQAVTQHEAQVLTWDAALKADPDLGGTKLDATISAGKRALDGFGPAGVGMAKILSETGYNSHPEVVRFLAAIGSAMREDRISTGNSSSRSNDLASRLYKPA